MNIPYRTVIEPLGGIYVLVGAIGKGAIGVRVIFIEIGIQAFHLFRDMFHTPLMLSVTIFFSVAPASFLYPVAVLPSSVFDPCLYPSCFCLPLRISFSHCPFSSRREWCIVCSDFARLHYLLDNLRLYCLFADIEEYSKNAVFANRFILPNITQHNFFQSYSIYNDLSIKVLLGFTER